MVNIMRFTYEDNKILRLRNEAAYSRELVARMARISSDMLNKVERNKMQTLEDRVMEGIAFALGVHPNDISPDYYPPTIPYVRRIRYNREMLRSRREALGLTLREVAEAAGVGLETVHHLEHRKDTARPETVRRVARALGLKPQDVSPALATFSSPEERELFGAAYGPGVLAYLEE
jgi:transcriptional regulator with XRE-family HTH domain